MNICKTGKFFFIPNKFWELQLAKWKDADFEVSVRFNTKGDHAGFKFDVYIWKINFIFQIVNMTM